MKTKNLAFTLAETLVVMGIIGVIAALTIPNLSQSTGNKEKVTRVQKAYSQLSEAVDRATAVYGSFSSWPLVNNHATDDAIVGDRITEFMKVSKNCRLDSNCVTYYPNSTNYHFQLADGTYINMSAYPGGIAFDIIIAKRGEHNVAGKNVFCSGFNPSGDVLVRSSYMTNDFETTLNNVKECVSSNPYTTNCHNSSLAWIINYGNMDYLKLNATTGKCPNGNELTESNPRCN